MHTNHTRKAADTSKLTEKFSNYDSALTEQDWEQAAKLLALLKLKVGYRKVDLLRDSQKIRNQERVYLDEMGDNLEEEPIDYRGFTKDWEFLLEDADLIDAVQKLTTRQREILWKMYAEGKSQQEIADELELSTPSISKTKNLAYKRIRQHLKEG